MGKKLLVIVIGLGAVLFGSVFVAIGGWFFIHNSALAKIAVAAPGVVTAMREVRTEQMHSSTRSHRRHSSSSLSYYPTVEFTAASGEKFRFESKMGGNPPAYNTGEQVRVLYDPQNPARAQIDSFKELWLFPLIFGGIGLITVVAAIAGIMIMLRVIKRTEKIMEEGMLVQARVIGIERQVGFRARNSDGSFSHRKVRYTITAEWRNPATGQTHIFTGKTAGIEANAETRDGTVNVYVMPNDPSVYVMETSIRFKDEN